ncbi:MAG: inositol monophosphatase family protein [Vicinamibacterales bacterium]
MIHSPFLDAAVDGARRAGRLQMDGFRRGVRVDRKGAIDLVTEIDIAVERMLRAHFLEHFPDHAILAEELGGPESTETFSHLWIVDPLDGTTNFAHGLPLFSVSIALEVSGALEVGVVYDPTRDELFAAERGRGAWLNGERLRVSRAETLVESVLCTGFPYDVHQTLDDIIALFAAFVGRARGVRRLGSAALDLSYVAAGRLDGFWEQRLRPWDIAAGALLVAEAGGRVTDWSGGAFRAQQHAVLASNGRIHDDMMAVIDGHTRRAASGHS